MLLRYHQKGDSGLRLTRARSVIMDALIQNLFEYAMEIAEDTIGKTKPMCVMATGGYGRRTQSHSDLDIMLLYPVLSGQIPRVAQGNHDSRNSLSSLGHGDESWPCLKGNQGGADRISKGYPQQKFHAGCPLSLWGEKSG